MHFADHPCSAPLLAVPRSQVRPLWSCTGQPRRGLSSAVSRNGSYEGEGIDEVFLADAHEVSRGFRW